MTLTTMWHGTNFIFLSEVRINSVLTYSLVDRYALCASFMHHSSSYHQSANVERGSPSIIANLSDNSQVEIDRRIWSDASIALKTRKFAMDQQNRLGLYKVVIIICFVDFCFLQKRNCAVLIPTQCTVFIAPKTTVYYEILLSMFSWHLTWDLSSLVHTKVMHANNAFWARTTSGPSTFIILIFKFKNNSWNI